MFVSVISVLTMLDSQFINIFYGTDLGTPGNLHMLLFVLFVVVTSVINMILLLFVRRKDTQATSTRSLLLRGTYIGTTGSQYTILLVSFIVIIEMVVFHAYDTTFSLFVIYVSHFWCVGILGILSFTFIRWFRFSGSFSMLTYAVVFIVIIYLSLVALPLLIQQFTMQTKLIYLRDYTNLITTVKIPSRDTAFIYGLGNYVLPVMIISSWILTVSLLKPYAHRIGKMFWLVISIPLFYQLFTFVVRDANLVTDPALIEIIYSKQVQFLFAISYQINGLFFAIAYLTIARKMKRPIVKNYLIICSIGIISLFSSIQPGTPFYAAYPPFGLVTLLLLGLSSYLLLVGMLGCAAYVARDSEIRREIHKRLDIDSDLLKMGRAEIHRQIETRVKTTIDKVKLSEDMGFRTDPDEEEIKVMIEEVLNEVHKVSDTKINRQ